MAVILFVDDDLGSRVLYEKACVILGHHALLAESGKLGLAMAIAQKPDLILLDLSLPDINGLAVLSKLRQDVATAHIPVVIVSAGMSEQDPLITREAGADAYLSKPIGLNDLQHTVNQFTVA